MNTPSTSTIFPKTNVKHLLDTVRETKESAVTPSAIHIRTCSMKELQRLRRPQVRYSHESMAFAKTVSVLTPRISIASIQPLCYKFHTVHGDVHTALKPIRTDQYVSIEKEGIQSIAISASEAHSPFQVHDLWQSHRPAPTLCSPVLVGRPFGQCGVRPALRRGTSLLVGLASTGLGLASDEKSRVLNTETVSSRELSIGYSGPSNRAILCPNSGA